MATEKHKVEIKEEVQEVEMLHGLYRVFFYGWFFFIVLMGALYLLPVYTEISEFSVATLLNLLAFLAMPVFIIAVFFGIYGLAVGIMRKSLFIALSGALMLLGTGLVSAIGLMFEGVIFS